VRHVGLEVHSVVFMSSEFPNSTNSGLSQSLKEPDPKALPMSREASVASVSSAVSSRSGSSEEPSPRVIVFLEGSRPRVEKAVEIVRELYGNRRLVWCASGLHSLAALRLGAAEVISFDYDPKPVEATSILTSMLGKQRTGRLCRSRFSTCSL
jgi:hypothetical protein